MGEAGYERHLNSICACLLYRQASLSDISLTKECKEDPKSCLHDWYASEVQQRREEGDVGQAQVNDDLRMSGLQPPHAGWVEHTQQNGTVETRHELVRLRSQKASTTRPIKLALSLN